MENHEPARNVHKRKWRKFLDLSRHERRLFTEALMLHLWVGLLIKVIPFRWIPQLFSSRQFETPPQEEDQSRYSVSGRQSATFAKASVAGSSLQSKDILFIQGAIQRAGRASPWKNRCLVSSLAGRCMLRKRKINSQLSLGVAKNTGGKTIAHAWLKAGNIEIFSAGGGFQELYQF
jgi:hypothetical protein